MKSTYQNKDWDSLSAAAKAEVAKVAIQKGIYSLDGIKNMYNEFADGGNINKEKPVIVPFRQKTEVIITPDSEYNHYLNTLPDNQRFTPNDKYDSYLYWKLNGKPRNFKEAYDRNMFHYNNSDNLYHANSIAWGDDGVGYFMKPKTHDTVGYELDWFNKGLITEEDGHQRPETPEEKLESDEFRKNYMLIDDPVRTNYYRYQPIEKAKGGSINIKQFAMGGDTSNTVPLGRRYWQAQSNVPTILEKKNTWVKQQKKQEDRKDKALRKWLQTEGVKELNKEVRDYLTASNATTWTAANKNPKNPHLQARVTKGAKAHASWEKEHPVLNTWGNVLGAAPFAVAAAPLVAAAGSGMAALGDAVAATSAGQAITAGLAPLATAASTNIAGAPLYTWADVGLSSLFGGHGIQTAINEGGISPTTALEIAPLGRLAKPMFNKTAMAIENYRYPLGRPQVPENFLTIKPQIRTRVGDVEIGAPNMAYRQGNDLGRTYQKYKDVDASVAQHQIEDNTEQLLSSRNGRPYISREKALDKAIANGTFDPAIGIEVDGHSAAYQDTPMYSDGFLWYGTPKIDETLPQGSLQSGLLVTPRNDAFIIGSNKATPYRGTGSGISRSKSGVTTVTDNGGRLIPADADNLGLELNNISAYNWEPGYGYRRVFTEEAPTIKWRDAVKSPKITSENAASTTPEVTHFYHGSPVRFDAFSADFIGSGEGGSKVMRGINLWPTERIANAPKLANIRSSDAPLHLGVPSTPLGGELNPTVYDVSGRGLKLYTTTPREVKGLSQSDLISQGYDGIQTPNQVTVFPESIGKLSIDKQSTIDQFILSHPEVERWTPWTTDKQKMQNIIDMSKMSKWTPEQWTIAQDAAIAKGDMTEARRLRDLHFKTKAPNTKITDSVWHGSRAKNFNIFDLKYFGRTDGGVDGYGHYFGTKRHAAAYKNPREFYLNMENPYTGDHAQFFNREEYFKDNELYERIPRKADAIRYKKGMEQYKQELLNKDGVIDTNPLWGDLGTVYLVPRSNQIKLADAVTYDDKGIRIPLGLRDNFKSNDIRWAGSIKEDYTSPGHGLLDYLKNDKINAFLEGKPFYERNLGPFGKRKESFPSDWTLTKVPFSNESKEIINNSAKPRILAQAEKDIRDVYDPTIDGPDVEKYVKGELSYVEKQLDAKINEGYELGSDALFKAHDEGKTAIKTGGLQLTNNGKIVLREGEDPEKFAVHEWEHRRTNSNIGGAHYGNEKRLLRKAFTKEFRELSETVPDFKGMNMDDEMVTTVSDTREALIGKMHLRKTAPDLQNKMIDKCSDEKVFKAVEKANAYGTFYIKKMRELGKLTPELAQNIREALKHVGAYVAPTGIGLGVLSSTHETK